MNRSRTFRIALGGICLALTLLLLFGGVFLPGVDLTMFALASLTTAVMVIETGIGGGALLFAGACILGFFLVPNKLALLPYIGFFGYWPILKYFIEKIKQAIPQIACKIAFLAALLCLGLLGFQELLASAVSLPDYPAALLILGGTALLLLYDYILSCLINWYYRRIKRIRVGRGDADAGAEDELKLS